MRHGDLLAAEKHHGGVGTRVAFDGQEGQLRTLLRHGFFDQEVEREMARHVRGASLYEFLREAQHGTTERRVGWEGFVVHEEFRRRAGDEGFDLVADDQSMRAVFSSLDELLQHPRLLPGYRYP